MKIIEDIVEEVRKTESDNTTNIILHYQDLEGDSFFEKMDALRWVLNVLYENHNLVLVEEKVVPTKYWAWDMPIYFDPKFHFLQFDLKRFKDDSHSDKEFTVECGSIWCRPVDGTVIEIQAIVDAAIYVKVLAGPGIMGDSLNHSVLHLFWNKKS
jgi:hypothetical protein